MPSPFNFQANAETTMSDTDNVLSWVPELVKYSTDEQLQQLTVNEAFSYLGLGISKPKLAIMTCVFKKLAEETNGKYLVGRRGHDTRIVWSDRQKVTTDPVKKVSFGRISLEFPVNLTLEEIEILGPIIANLRALQGSN